MGGSALCGGAKVRQRDARQRGDARGLEFRLDGAARAGHWVWSSHAREISWLCGGGHSHAGTGYRRKHGYFQPDRRGNAAVTPSRGSFAVGPAQMGCAQRAEHSRVHVFRRLSNRFKLRRSQSVRVLVLRTDVPGNRADKFIFREGRVRQLWQAELVRKRPCNGSQRPARFGRLLPYDGRESGSGPRI